MVIFKCDKCGAEHKHSGIVTNMQKQFGYEQLTIPFGDVRDVCKSCYKEVVKAVSAARREEKITIRQRAASLLGLSGQ